MKHLNRRILATAFIITAIIIGMSFQNSNAQSVYKLTPGKDASIKVLGTSNVHDWALTSTSMESQGEFKLDDKQLRAFSFSLNAKSLKSEHESMDNRTYKTMKADQYPKVTYKLISAVVTPVQKNKYTIKATGDLTIAGVTQTIVMNVSAVVNADNTISCSGSENIKLTDYKIDPPSFMLGAMKVKNDLTIQFNLTYKNN
ncbi:YceI family protein [Mucilaginibacter sp. UR6-11]|uniref:YceI family protein n=1 Tax=Mucilaginibacter sp. UR6-11 TaxID=1435644 RepID=UPI001E559B1C|nr:YceI family protein [Mucilaginibacter sp. UR6-11]MCC8424915.1 YceI family protein [Mucilaginibacter sp. UR6-11]